MNKAAFIGLLFALAAALSSGGRAAARPIRVMSINGCSDQLVLALLPPAQISSVTWLSRDPSGSEMAQAAARVPVNHGSAEEVLRDHPDLVIAGTYTTPATRALLKKIHYPLLELTPPDTFEDIRRDTRKVAAAVGATERGEVLIARMDATLRRLSQTSGPPVRVAAWDGAGFSAQAGSMYDTILRAAGARNVASEAAVTTAAAPGVETLLATAPDMLIRGEPGSEGPGRRTDAENNPIIQGLWRDRTVIVSQRDYACGTPSSADAAARLRRKIQAVLARPKPPLPFSPAGLR